jgi:DsbC/DsbD-like thiol-disulfide interchange protein
MRFLPLAVILLAAPASAGETAWQELAPDVRARLITSDVLEADGTTLVGIELDMPSNTKTYWRIPGETGIATELDFAGSMGIASHEVLWPFPTVEHVLGYMDYVYYGPTVLPVVLTIEKDASAIELATTLGVCSDICVPAVASFSLPLSFARADAGQRLRLQQALSLTPVVWDGAGSAIGEVVYDAAAAGLTVPVSDPSIDQSSLIADTGDPLVLFGTPQKSPDGHSVFLPLLGSVSADLGGQAVRITFMTDMGPYEISRQIRSASTESAN